MPVVLYLRGLCHLHLSTGSPEDKLPRNKNTEKIICLPAARASGERRAKGPLGFPTNAGKRRAEDSDAEVTGRRRKKRRGERERSRWTRARRKGDDSREEGKKRGGSPGEDEGGDKGRLQREEERRNESEKERERASPGPKAAKKPLKKTA